MIRLLIAGICGFILLQLIRIVLYTVGSQLGFGILPFVNRFWSMANLGGFGIILISMSILMVIWVIYKIVSKIPLIGKIIIKKVPPFAELKASGIFGLFDNIFGIIFSRQTIPSRFVNFGKALGHFAMTDSEFVLSTFGKLVPPLPSEAPLAAGASNKPHTKMENPNFRQSDADYMQDNLNQCFEENLIPITPDMSSSEHQAAKLQNEGKRTMCRTKQLQVYMDTITQKLPN